MDPVYPTKICNTCYVTKPLDAFSKDSHRKDGHSGCCSQCRNDLRADLSEEEKARIKAQRAAHYQAHLEEIRAVNRARTTTDEFRAKRREKMAPVWAAKKEALQEKRANAPIPEEKLCPQCENILPLDAFGPDKSRRDGHGGWCRQCERNKRNSEEYKARRRPREQKRRDTREPDQRESENERIKAWRIANPLKAREHVMRRNARKRASTVDPVNYKRILERDGSICYICGKAIGPDEKLEYDHVIPLSRGGAHSEGNIKPTHQLCNRRKWNHLPTET